MVQPPKSVAFFRCNSAPGTAFRWEGNPGLQDPDKSAEYLKSSGQTHQRQEPEKAHRAINHRVHLAPAQADSGSIGEERAQPRPFLPVGLRRPPAAHAQPILQIVEDAGVAIE